MNSKDNHNITELSDFIREELPKITKNVDKIERAIYGDPANGVPGLIDYNKSTQHEMQKIDKRFEHKISEFEKTVDENVKEINDRINTLEQLKNKIGWTLSGLVAGSSAVGASIWEFLSRMK